QQPFARQRAGLDRRARGAMVAEHPRVRSVHVGELLHVGEEDAAAQHVSESRSGRFENRLDVPETLRRLRRDVVAGELARGRIGRALTGDEDEPLEGDAGGVRSDGYGKIGGANVSMHEASMSSLRRLLGIRYPIVQSGMGRVAGPELAAEVSRAGGLGILAGLNLAPDELRQQARRVRELTDRPFGV